MHDQQQQPPIETPTTPSTPAFPPFDVLSFSRRASLAESIEMRSMGCRDQSRASISSGAEPLEAVAIARPVAVRRPQDAAKSSSPSSVQDTSSHPRQAKRSKCPPPNYHLRVITSEATANNTAAMQHVISHLSIPLVPLISVTSGHPHPGFPSSILQFHLLTHPQLDDLARYYHQVTPPVPQTMRYPISIPAWVRSDTAEAAAGDVDLETKRRRWGRFVGLRGCESPVRSAEADDENIEERMEREWKRALEQARRDEEMADKGWRGRF